MELGEGSAEKHCVLGVRSTEMTVSWLVQLLLLGVLGRGNGTTNARDVENPKPDKIHAEDPDYGENSLKTKATYAHLHALPSMRGFLFDSFSKSATPPFYLRSLS